MQTAAVGTHALAKPIPSEIDVFGATHRGNVRRENADHFLVASFHRAMRVHASSIPMEALEAHSTDSRGYVFFVADGVGAFAQAADGSAKAIQSVARYLVNMSEISLQAEPERAGEVLDRLRAAFAQAHETLLGLVTGGGVAVTTLTMLIAMWPRMFVIHAGDSRAYRLRAGVLEQLTIDQTMAQAMVDAGAMTRTTAAASPLRHVLLSALGSTDVDPQVSALDLERTDRFLLCTDGLTKHVTDAEIRDRLLAGGPAEAICQSLIHLSLSRGGEDNVTVVVGKAR